MRVKQLRTCGVLATDLGGRITHRALITFWLVRLWLHSAPRLTEPRANLCSDPFAAPVQIPFAVPCPNFANHKTIGHIRDPRIP
jgi:hypothetical protein